MTVATLAKRLQFAWKRNLSLSAAKREDEAYACGSCGVIVPAYCGVRNERMVACSDECARDIWSSEVW